VLTTPDSLRRIHRLLAAGSVAVVAAAALPASAGAAYTVTNGVSCGESVSAAFSEFGDPNLYALAPGGDMETGVAGWTLSKARLIAGSEPYAVTGVLGASALQLDAGGVVTTAPVCVDPTRETFRLFVRNVSNSKARVKVEALFNRKGTRYSRTVSVGYVTTPIGVWQPSPVLRNQASKTIAAGTVGDVTYRFSAENGAVVIDDLHVDPRFRG